MKKLSEYINSINEKLKINKNDAFSVDENDFYNALSEFGEFDLGDFYEEEKIEPFTCLRDSDNKLFNVISIFCGKKPLIICNCYETKTDNSYEIEITLDELVDLFSRNNKVNGQRYVYKIYEIIS